MEKTLLLYQCLYHGYRTAVSSEVSKIIYPFNLVVGSKEWTLNELEKLNISLGKTTKQLPSNQDLEKYHPKLVKSLRLHFLSNQLYQNNNSEHLNQEERLEIAKNSGYEAFIGSKEWCLQELNKITDSQQEKKVFPSNEQLNHQHSDLEPSIREHFTQTKEYGELSEQDRLEVVKNLGYNVIEEVKQHTTL